MSRRIAGPFGAGECMNRGILFLIAVIAALTSCGVAAKVFYYTWRAPTPVVMQCADYLRNRPDVVWVDLRDCTLDYEFLRRAYYVKAGLSSTDDNYVPIVRALGDTSIALFLKTSDAESAYLNALPDNPTRAQKTDIHVKLRSLMFHRRIKGLIQTSFDSNVQVNQVMENAHLTLAQGWKIVHEEEPWPLWIGYVSAPISLVAGLLALWMFRRNRAARAQANAAAV
jgi:hypothetical protein